ncbi:MAG: hypothetical protein E6K53_12250 [Gammaproteobacteria bacterium]|nr:MAG: hypothetical protein E6K53_12250 [Gammaproteobacteria bacterium]
MSGTEYTVTVLIDCAASNITCAQSGLACARAFQPPPAPQRLPVRSPLLSECGEKPEPVFDDALAMPPCVSAAQLTTIVSAERVWARRPLEIESKPTKAIALAATARSTPIIHPCVDP